MSQKRGRGRDNGWPTVVAPAKKNGCQWAASIRPWRSLLVDVCLPRFEFSWVAFLFSLCSAAIFFVVLPFRDHLCRLPFFVAPRRFVDLHEQSQYCAYKKKGKRENKKKILWWGVFSLFALIPILSCLFPSCPVAFFLGNKSWLGKKSGLSTHTAHGGYASVRAPVYLF
nr:hypothetical protein [Pandoravirus aubagnensis]